MPAQSASPAAGQPRGSRLRYAMSGTGWYYIGRRLFTGHASFEVAGGVVLILSGLYMLNAFFIVIPALAV